MSIKPSASDCVAITLKLVPTFPTFPRKQLFVSGSWMKMLAVSLSPISLSLSVSTPSPSSLPLDNIMNKREGLTDVNEAVCIRLSCDHVETCSDLSEEAAVCVRVMDEDVSCLSLPYLSLSLCFYPFPPPLSLWTI
jgi:hypothetical protein